MDKWKCQICGAVFEGAEAPENCPVCGVDSRYFKKLGNENPEKEEPEEMEAAEKVYSFKCTVCGEIVEGKEPPESCPVCGVDARYFVRIDDEVKSDIFDRDEKFVIIGASGAGMGAAEEIRKRNKKGTVTIVSKENVLGYYRPQLSKMLSNNLNPESLAIKNEQWFKENNVDLILDKEVKTVDTGSRHVILANGEQLEYTKLVVASGAEVFVPPIIGRDKAGVFTLRYVKDAFEIKEYAAGKKSAAVIGGGVLGLEAASELNNLGLDVTVIEMADRILPRQLDKNGSEILEKIVKEAGVRFRTMAAVKEISGDKEVSGVLLEDGETIPADIVIISTGVRANCHIVSSALEVKRAIVVNNKMETSAPDVYACGDCAEFDGINYALWSEAIVQGKTAGINASGDEAIYEQIIPSTTLNAFNSSVFSIGNVGGDADENYEVKDEGKNSYKKLYFRDGILSGGMLIGDTSKTVDLMAGFENKKSRDEMIKIIM